MNIILLSGGSGKRLWPLSNDIRSKQFLKLFKGPDGECESMVQRVFRQIKTVDTDASVVIATAKTQVSALYNQLGSDIDISGWDATPVVKMPPITVTKENVDSITADMRW